MLSKTRSQSSLFQVRQIFRSPYLHVWTILSIRPSVWGWSLEVRRWSMKVRLSRYWNFPLNYYPWLVKHSTQAPNLLRMSQPHFEGSVQSSFTFSKMGLGSPPGLPKTQSSILGVKTPCLEVFFTPLERSWSVDVQNGLAWAIWTSVAQVMVERRAGSQIVNLTPQHKKSGVNPTLVCAGGVWHTVGKLSRRATSLL